MWLLNLTLASSAFYTHNTQLAVLVCYSVVAFFFKAVYKKRKRRQVTSINLETASVYFNRLRKIQATASPVSPLILVRATSSPFRRKIKFKH